MLLTGVFKYEDNAVSVWNTFTFILITAFIGDRLLNCDCVFHMYSTSQKDIFGDKDKRAWEYVIFVRPYSLKLVMQGQISKISFDVRIVQEV